MLNPTVFDWAILLLFLGVALGTGLSLRKSIRTSRDFLQAGCSLPAWVSGLAFVSLGVGAPEVIAMGAWGAHYGLQAAQFYLLGAVPAMLFAGLYLAPVFHGSGARSVPDYLRLRFDGRTRTLHAALLAASAIVTSGVLLAVAGRVLQALGVFDGLFFVLGWPMRQTFLFSIVLLAVVVLAYVLLGGLAAAVYNQVLQFLLLVAALLPLVYLGLVNIGGWAGLKAAVPAAHMHLWSGILHGGNAMGLDAVSLVLGVGLVLGAGYWCADFRVMQTAMAAESAESAQRAPMIAAIPRMLLPLLVVLPGLIAIGLPTPRTSMQVREQNGAIYHDTTVVPKQVEAGTGLVPARVDPASGQVQYDAAGHAQLDYALAMPSLMGHYFPTALLGLGIAALLAGFLSGLAGNLAAFNTVFTCDLYEAHVRKGESDKHYLLVGRLATVAGVLLSVAAAFAIAHLHSVLAVLLLAFAVVNAPVLAVLLLGVFWKRATAHGAFAGVLAGAVVAVLHHGIALPAGAGSGVHGGWIDPMLHYSGDLALGLYGGIAACSVALVVAALVSLLTAPRAAQELAGLVYSLTPQASTASRPWWKRPQTLAALILLAALALNIVFA